MRVAVMAMIAVLTAGASGPAPGGAAPPAAPRAAASDAVKVTKGNVALEYKRFDPDRPPNPPPPLEKGEAAVTVYRFGVEVDAKYSYPQQANAPPGPVKLDVTVEEIAVKLSLSVTIWLPDKASKELEQHEEAHRWIAERFYADAERLARPLAQKWVGKKLPGEGRDAKAAARAAADRLSGQLCTQYLDAINAPCERAQTIFDELTDHGRNVRPGPKEGMERAVAEARKKK